MRGTILKGEMFRITGSVAAHGDLFWIEPGKQSVRAATIAAKESFIIGPYLNDATYEIVMRDGAPIIENLGKTGNCASVPLADFSKGIDYETPYCNG